MAGRPSTKGTETENKEVKETKVEAPAIDIDAIVKEAVTKAVVQTSEKYQDEINRLNAKLEDCEKTIKENQNKNVNPTQIIVDTNVNSHKRVKIMHMGAGSAMFSKGHVNVYFDKLFDIHEVRYDIFQEMYDYFSTWFTNFELVILDKDVREEFGLDYNYNEFGADKDTFYEMLKMNTSECLHKLEKLTSVVALSFLKFFMDEFLNHNVDASSKFADIENFYRTRYSIENLQQSINEMLTA